MSLEFPRAAIQATAHPHTGQSSQLSVDAVDGSAQFLSTGTRSGLIGKLSYVPHILAPACEFDLSRAARIFQ